MRLLIKDFAEFTASPQMLVFALLVPSVILFFVGQLSVREADVTLLVAGAPDCQLHLEQGDQQSGQDMVGRGSPAAGATSNGYLGIQVMDLYLTEEQRKGFSPDGAGVVVAETDSDGPASRAGLWPGTVVIAADGKPLYSSWELDEIISGLPNGHEIALTTVGERGPEDVAVRLAEQQASAPLEHLLLQYLTELPDLQLRCEENAVSAPLARIAEEKIDLLLNVEDQEMSRWALHIAETNPLKVEQLQVLARGIRMFRAHWPDPDNPSSVVGAAGLIGAIPLQPARLYYPAAADRHLALLPQTFCLIVCFLGFAVSAPTLIREREAHTLEILMTASGGNAWTVFAAKCLFPLIVTLLAAVFMLVTTQSLHHLYVKADAIFFFLFLALPILSSVFLGMTISALARSQSQTVIAAAVYFFCLLLFSGFLYVPEESSEIIQWASRLLGLTYLLDPANRWMFGAELSEALVYPTAYLLLQCLCYCLIAWGSWRFLIHRL